jgi:hypothetical protein
MQNMNSNYLALIRAVIFFFLDLFFFRSASKFDFFNLGISFVKQTVVDFLVVRHFKDKVEQKLIDFDVSLLVVILIYLECKFIFFQRYFYFFPYFKLCLKLNHYS